MFVLFVTSSLYNQPLTTKTLFISCQHSSLLRVFASFDVNSLKHGLSIFLPFSVSFHFFSFLGRWYSFLYINAIKVLKSFENIMFYFLANYLYDILLRVIIYPNYIHHLNLLYIYEKTKCLNCFCQVKTIIRFMA